MSHLFRTLDMSTAPPVRFLLAQGIKRLLLTGKTPIGLSGSELTISFYRQFKKCITGVEDTQCVKELIQCMDAMASHKDNAVQKYDILSLLLSKTGKISGFPSFRSDDDRSSTSHLIQLNHEQKIKLRAMLLESARFVARVDGGSLPLEGLSRLCEQLCSCCLDSDKENRLYAMWTLKEIFSHGCRLKEDR